jgi:hypothetical protein
MLPQDCGLPDLFVNIKIPGNVPHCTPNEGISPLAYTSVPNMHSFLQGCSRGCTSDKSLIHLAVTRRRDHVTHKHEVVIGVTV